MLATISLTVEGNLLDFLLLAMPNIDVNSCKMNFPLASTSKLNNLCSFLSIYLYTSHFECLMPGLPIKNLIYILGDSAQSKG